ncbi:Capsular polysaccharide biosynthesis protein [Marinococcus luteus]|uniref:Capsular polysaccharide biosynthesis protein n=1 Tax=Marinococcus luteus TaxID=1122204 RepID=A0A1H2TFR7_9BACI|nr:Wzz/FepE/Etk N-terminal domain-containing protein [Marinococcus luteus]SDW42712.1 Capsular polysaccharide biosynthesis protein [Marinococcus luteus]
MEETINFKEVFQTIKKRFNVIIGTTIGALLISAFVTFFILTPQYEASSQILVNQSQTENEELSATDLQSSRELINTYNVIMVSPAILNSVMEETNYQGTVSDLRSQINVSAEEESQVVTVTVEDEDPQKAVSVVNTLSQIFEQEISNIMDVDNVSILSEAQIEDSENPVFPQPTLNLVIALVIGFIVGIGIAFLLEFLDKTIKNEEDIEKELQLPILGVVPLMSEKELNQPKTTSGKQSRAKTREGERKTS